MNILTENKDKIKYGVCKYANIMGVTCYMNSILHILQQLPIFTEYIVMAKFDHIINEKIENEIKENPNLNKIELLKKYVSFELFKLFKISLENDDLTITPYSFKNIIGQKNSMWNEHQQQDSQEFFNFLISNLEEEIGVKTEFILGSNLENKCNNIIQDNLNNIIATESLIKYQSKEYSIFKNLFNGTIENTKKCIYCKNKTYSFEPFITLPLSIPINSKNDTSSVFDIYDCFDNLISEEQLDINNKINCCLCGLKNRAYSKSLLYKTPKILVIHIKRFKVNSFGMRIQKITNNVTYPIKNLDLEKYFDPASPYKKSSKYDLIGINIHESMGLGNNINMGHYTSIIKNTINNNWHLYNDSHTVQRMINKDHLQQSNAYLLFYYRHD